MSAKSILSNQLYLFPNSPNTRFSSQRRLTLAPRRTSSSGGLRARASAAAAASAVCAPAQTSADSFYQLLGIPATGSISDIKAAYKQLARKYHPDVSPSECAEEYTRRFLEVREAYETLSDPRTRALYDMDLARGMHLNFSSRRRRSYEDEVETAEWSRRWETQLEELKRRSTVKDSGAGGGSSRGQNMSWETRPRRRRNNIFDIGFK